MGFPPRCSTHLGMVQVSAGAPARRAEDDSPAIHRWGTGHTNKTSPVRDERAPGAKPRPSFAPAGLRCCFGLGHPPLKRWAIFARPYGTIRIPGQRGQVQRCVEQRGASAHAASAGCRCHKTPWTACLCHFSHPLREKPAGFGFGCHTQAQLERVNADAASTLKRVWAWHPSPQSLGRSAATKQSQSHEGEIASSHPP